MNRLLDMFRTPLVITDGAWGTQLQERGLAPGEPGDLWNLEHPERVQSVAQAYVDAGSQVILTNTFRANAVSMAGLSAERLAEVNRQGVRHSRMAAGSQGRVFASIGPTGKLLSVGEIDETHVSAAFVAQAAALAEGGADAIVLETFSELDEARLAIRAVRSTGLPVIISFAFDSGKNKDRTMMGVKPEQAAQLAAEEQADAVGANCGAGPDAFLAVCSRLSQNCDLPVWIKPNAGLPVLEAGRAVYAMTPTEFAAFVPGLRQAGARFLGGCCGTSPAFIAALRDANASCEST